MSSLLFFLRSSYLSSMSWISLINFSFGSTRRFSICTSLFPSSVTFVTSGSRSPISLDKFCEKENKEEIKCRFHSNCSSAFEHGRRSDQIKKNPTFAAAKSSSFAFKSPSFCSCFWRRDFSSHKSSFSFKLSRFLSQSRILFCFSNSTYRSSRLKA